MKEDIIVKIHNDIIIQNIERDTNYAIKCDFDFVCLNVDGVKVLLTAYEKEKEKNKELEDTLKQTQNSWYEDTKVIEKQSKEIEKYKNVIDNREFTWKQKYEETFEYVKENYISKDKIKAKIEELDYNDIGNFERRCKKEVLEKE